MQIDEISNKLCLCSERQKKVVSKDVNSRRKHIANNISQSNIEHYKIDGDVIQDNSTKRCDFLLKNNDKKDAYLIEIKGVNISDAFEQLLSTSNILKNVLKNYTIHYRIVHNSNTHEIRDTKFQRFRKQVGLNIKTSSKQLEENI